MEQDDLVDNGLDAYNLRVLAGLLAVLTAVTWFVVMLLVLDDEPHRLQTFSPLVLVIAHPR